MDKIFPWMRTEEEEDEKEFYAHRGIELKPEYAEETSSLEKKGRSGKGGKHSSGGNLLSQAASQMHVSSLCHWVYRGDCFFLPTVSHKHIFLCLTFSPILFLGR